MKAQNFTHSSNFIEFFRILRVAVVRLPPTDEYCTSSFSSFLFPFLVLFRTLLSYHIWFWHTNSQYVSM